ncbi:MAG: B12-binding domain-containing radical SAM protein [Deltaproteobacteria bacterium]|nr:B12-binding domain-containing radical SAM protein [Deltaproteobacteria bacterium]
MNIAVINGPTSDGSMFMREGRCTQKSSIWSTQWPPISLAYLAAVARCAGHAPTIFDCPAAAMSQRDLIRALDRGLTDLALVSVATPTFDVDMRNIASLRAARPAMRIGVFGVHATARDKDILRGNPAIDYVLRREPEETAAELFAGSPAPSIAGLTHRADGEIVRNADRPYLEDLDALPLPAWDAGDLSLYRLPFSRRRFVCVAPHRGCPYRCSFCTAGAYYGRKLRLRRVDAVVEEIHHVHGRFGARDLFMWADTFTLDNGFTVELSRAIRKANLGIRWTCNSRPDGVTQETFGEMASSGCWMVSFGIESASEEVLRRAHKKLDLRTAAETVGAAKRAGLTTLGHFIFGMPGDTRESLAATAALARSLDLDFAQFYAAAPFVGSELYEQALAENLLAGSDMSVFHQGQASLRLEGLPPEDVDAARRKATIRFYLRPRRLLGLIRLAGIGALRQLGVLINETWKRRIVPALRPRMV